MWMYKEPTTPPTHTVDALKEPLTDDMISAESFAGCKIHLFYRASGYSGVITLCRTDTSSAYYRNIKLPAKVYDAIVDLRSGMVTSLRNNKGEWLIAPEEVGTIKWYRSVDTPGHGDPVWRNPPAISRGYFSAGVNPIYITPFPYIGESKAIKTASLQVQYKSEEGDMDIVTGYIGEPHITAVQDRDTNRGIFGEDSYILNVGQKLAAEIVSAQEIRIRDGAVCHQGCVGTIGNGSYDSLTISNGSQGMKRSDLIVARYAKDPDTNVESITLVVIEGTPAASSPADPSYNSGDIRDGDSPVDFPLYRVNIDGVSIDSVTRLAPVIGALTSYSGTFGKSGTVTLNAATKLRKVGSLVVFNIDASTSAQIATGSAGQGFIVFPVGFRPENGASFVGRNTSGVVCEYYLQPSGNLQTLTAIPANATFRLSGSFTID